MAIMAERNVEVVHLTILRWGQQDGPEFEKRRQQYMRPVGTSGRVGESYLKGKGAFC